jgi:hypothetical protein
VKKENVRILWNNKNGKISEFKLMEINKFPLNDYHENLHKQYNSWNGVGCSGWDDMNITDVLFEFYVLNDWESDELKDSFLMK